MSDLLEDGNSITHHCLVSFRRRGLRNGNWGRLNVADKALFRCAFWVAEVRGKISSTRLMVQVLKVALKLVEGVRTAIMKVGRRRTGQMFETYEKPPGVFGWAPQVRDWLNDSTFIRYLGALGVNP